MKKYDSYKESGVEWIGEIPSHWDITRIKYKFQIGRGRVISNEDLVEDAKYPVYSSQTLNNGCLGYIETFDFDDKLITWTTDGANAGTVFLREGKFNCTNVCGTLKRKSDDVIPEFDYYFLQYATQFYKRPDTNGAKIMNNEMAVILSLKLSNEEQTAIANYLDQKTSQIDDLIAKKERLIQLLEEERTAIINHAVTKGLPAEERLKVGLDTTVPMKYSGIEWLGEIPAHWSYSSLKWYSKIYSGGTPSKDVEEYWLNGTIPWLNSGCVNQWDITEVSDYITEEAFNNSSAKWIPNKSLVIALAGQGKTKGMVAQVQFETTCNQSLGVIVPNEKIYNRFLQYWLKNNYQNIRSLGGGDKRDGLNLVMIGGIPIPVLTVNEQEKIANYLDSMNLEIDSIKAKTEQEIELLKEYKTALISEVVTGKIDVRNEKLNS